MQLDQTESSTPLLGVQEPVPQQFCGSLGFGDLQSGPRNTSDSAKWPSKKQGSNHLCSSVPESIFDRLADWSTHSVRCQKRDLLEVAGFRWADRR